MIFYKFFEQIQDGLHHHNGELRHFDKNALEGFKETVPLVFVRTDNAFWKSQSVDLLAGPEKFENEPIDLPFKTCFFEMLYGPVTSIIENKKELPVAGIWIKETAPWEYSVLAFLSNESDSGRYTTAVIDQENIKPRFLNIVKKLLERMNREEVGFSNPRKFIKVKPKNKPKVTHRISKVVYVVPKNQINDVSVFAGKEINWTHQWTVRGHWRKLPGRIGKDRDGNPIADFSWVTNHVKGPSGAPLIKKVRVVK